jgi:dolichol-phosphate mannosyltransferase
LITFISRQIVDKCDIVTGTRYNNGGGIYGWNPIRKLISRGANVFASFFLNSQISDLTGSFRLYRKEVFLTLLTEVKNSGYAFQMEILVKAQYLNYTISEVPVTFVDRLMGKSKLGFNEIFVYIKTVLNLYTIL